MHRYWLVLAAFSLSASAQQPPAPTPAAACSPSAPMKVGHGPMRGASDPHTFISAQQIAKRIAAADAAVAACKPYSGEPLLLQDGHRVTMEWRNTAQKGVHAHLTDAEMFVILEGSGTLSIGGTLVNPKLQPAGPYEGPTLSADTVVGATEYQVSKGDMLMIPENTAHYVSQVNGKLVLWSMIMPRPAAATDTGVPPAAAPAPVAR